MKDYEQAAIDFAAMIDKLGLSVNASFVPLSQSRNSPDKGNWQSLNWKCDVLRNGQPVIGLAGVDYSQGAAHCPSYKTAPFGLVTARDKWQHGNLKVKADAIAVECETGRIAVWRWQAMEAGPKRIEPPSATDVLSAIVIDSDVIDYSGFEDWADCVGMDSDSRKAERTYRQCVEQALALRAAIGNEQLEAMRNLAGEM